MILYKIFFKTEGACKNNIDWCLIFVFQLSAFSNLRFDNRSAMINTYRPVQPRYGREVYRSGGYIFCVSTMVMVISVLTTLYVHTDWFMDSVTVKYDVSIWRFALQLLIIKLYYYIKLYHLAINQVKYNVCISYYETIFFILFCFDLLYPYLYYCTVCFTV